MIKTTIITLITIFLFDITQGVDDSDFVNTRCSLYDFRLYNSHGGIVQYGSVKCLGWNGRRCLNLRAELDADYRGNLDCLEFYPGNTTDLCKTAKLELAKYTPNNKFEALAIMSFSIAAIFLIARILIYIHNKEPGREEHERITRWESLPVFILFIAFLILGIYFSSVIFD